MSPHLGLQRIMVPSVQVSSLTTGSITLPSAKGTFNSWAGPEGAYDALSTVTVGTTVSSITFAGIPNTYKHLQIRAMCLNTGQDTLFIAYNGDTTGSNYRDHQVGGNGTGSGFAYSNAGVNGGGAGIGLTSQTAPAGNIIDILDYTNISKNTVARSLWGVDRNGAGSVGLFSNLWINTTAVTSITLSAFTYPFSQYSQFALYGVK
jgi:hypothetical protein